MPRRTGVESILGEQLRSAEQAESALRHDEVQIAAHPADRAVAIAGTQARWRQHLEGYCATMTAATVGEQLLRQASRSPRRNGHCSRSTLPPDRMMPTR